METASAHSYQHGLTRVPDLALAALVAALVLIALGVLLTLTLGTGHEAGPLLAPFRWEPIDPFLA